MTMGILRQVDKILKSITREEIVRLTAKLIRIESHRDVKDQELRVANFMREYFESSGVEVSQRKVAGRRSNVVAILKGATTRGRSLMLNGHLDTVPTYSWDAPVGPFSGKMLRSRIYGRGASDMKGALACMAVAMKALKTSGLVLAGDLAFSGVVGEEGSCSIGAEEIAKNGPHTKYAIVGEPTDLDICVAHKGIYYFEVVVKGKTTHSATPKLGVNAIEKCGKLLGELSKIVEIGPRHRLLGRTTLVPTVIKGGYRGDVVPDSCSLQVVCRNTPGYDVRRVKKDLQEIIGEIEAKDGQFEAELRLPARTFPWKYGSLIFDPRPVEIARDSVLVRSLARNVRRMAGKIPKVKGLGMFTDASILRNHGGIEACVCGPGGPECGAHSSIEFIGIKDLVVASRVYAATAIDICGISC